MLGYHGCDADVAERLLAGEDFRSSQNEYDWLGPGIYFWEANPRRGLEFAAELKKRRRSTRIRTPAVVGAVVDLGLCLDLTTSAGIEQVAVAYERLVPVFESAGRALPKNSQDLLRRNLDCTVIRYLHDVRAQQGLQSIETLKGVFIEGSPIYESSGFLTKTHTQICVRNPECIKGVFRVPRRFLD